MVATILRPFELVTADITYRLPDYPSLVQQFIWQDYDIPPDLRRLRKLLDYWDTNLEGRLVSVRVAHASLFASGVRYAKFLDRIH